jgi:hypothetical protein
MANSDDPDLRASATAALGLYGAEGLPNTGKLSADFTKADRAADLAAHQEQMRPLERDQKQASINASNSSIANSALQRRLTQRQLDSQAEQQQTQDLIAKMQLMARDAVDENGLPVAGSMTSAAEMVLRGQKLPDRVKAAVMQAATQSDASLKQSQLDYLNENTVLGNDNLNPFQTQEGLRKFVSGITDDADLRQNLVKEVSQEMGRKFTLPNGETISYPLNLAKMAITRPIILLVLVIGMVSGRQRRCGS